MYFVNITVDGVLLLYCDYEISVKRISGSMSLRLKGKLLMVCRLSFTLLYFNFYYWISIISVDNWICDI